MRRLDDASPVHVTPTASRSPAKLSTQLLNGSGLALATARVPALPRCPVMANRATHERGECFHRRRRLTESGHGDERPTQRPDDGVNRVPGGITQGILSATNSTA